MEHFEALTHTGHSAKSIVSQDGWPPQLSDIVWWQLQLNQDRYSTWNDILNASKYTITSAVDQHFQNNFPSIRFHNLVWNTGKVCLPVQIIYKINLAAVSVCVSDSWAQLWGEDYLGCAQWIPIIPSYICILILSGWIPSAEAFQQGSFCFLTNVSSQILPIFDRLKMALVHFCSVNFLENFQNLIM